MAPTRTLPNRRNPQEAGRRTDRLRALSHALIMAEERERRALAKDLHDDLGQLLAIVALKVSAVRRHALTEPVRAAVDECAQALAQANHKVRAMALQLAPPMLDQLGLVPSLQWLAEEVHRAYGVAVDIRDIGTPATLDPLVSAALFRAVRELLHNVSRHAGVSQAVVITTRGEGDTVIVSVSDAGVGFDADLFWAPDPPNSPSAGYSLLGLSERFGFLGGQVTIDSSPGHGCTVTIEVPVQLADLIESRKPAKP